MKKDGCLSIRIFSWPLQIFFYTPYIETYAYMFAIISYNIESIDMDL